MEVKHNELKPNKTQIGLIARALNGVIKGFYDDPENEAKFQKWLKSKKGGKQSAEVKRASHSEG